jgi:hypothetical protein
MDDLLFAASHNPTACSTPHADNTLSLVEPTVGIPLLQYKRAILKHGHLFSDASVQAIIIINSASNPFC